MAAQQFLKIVYALDIKFRVRWCICSMWKMLLPYYLLFLISIILFLKTDILYYILSRTELTRFVIGTIFLVSLNHCTHLPGVLFFVRRSSFYVRHLMFFVRCLS